MVWRQEYLQQLISWKEEQVIKVISGIRRCGKSTLLQQYQEYLISNGISKQQIISINFEDLDFENLLHYKKLYEYLRERLCENQMTYIFLDEIQRVPSFQKAVDSLYIKENVDLYITGSNAYLLSGDLATLLTGRYVEISMLPLSYREYCEATGKPSSDELFSYYMKYGGFPYLANMNRSDEKVDMYLEGIYNTVIINDIEERQKRKETDPSKRKINDISLLKSIAKYLASVIGSPVSVKGITNYLVSNGRKVSPNTVNDYINALTESFVFYPASRYDLVGKQLLKANKKYYMVDLGIRNHILPRKNYDLGFSIENIVYFELLRRRYHVNIGKYSNTEVDFVAEKQGTVEYFQVTATMADPKTFEREMAPLRNLKDNYPKTVLTLDQLTLGNYDGILVKNILDWLMSC
ncbi:MAG: ATP-binding protein [Lachnospiraceae bacterium]|nr:ATP-binding protein [Lachnospiraceae bacterium]